jgi:hypothetical protein
VYLFIGGYIIKFVGIIFHLAGDCCCCLVIGVMTLAGRGDDILDINTVTLEGSGCSVISMGDDAGF